MRRALLGIAAGAVIASFTLTGCDRSATALAQTNLDAGYGQPNPMPGSPLGDAGFAPYPGTPTPTPGEPVPGAPGTPLAPGASNPQPASGR